MTALTVVDVEFAAAHLYYQPKWRPDENQRVFGKCYSEHGHGHNYRLEVGFAASSLDANFAHLQANVKKVAETLDHRHLNFVVPEFQSAIPTTENIAIYLLKKLEESCPSGSVSYIKLFETDNLWVEIRK